MDLASPQLKRVLGPLLALATLLLTAYLGYLIAQPNLNYQALMSGAVLLGAVGTVLSGRVSADLGLLLWVLLFGLGYRTISLTPLLKLHPLIPFIVYLFALVLIQAYMFRREAQGPALPRFLLLFGLFWVWGWVPGLLRGQPWDGMVAESLSLAMLLPIFIVVRYVLARPGSWRMLVGAFFAVGAAIALLGTLEAIFPRFSQLIPGYVRSETVAGVDQFGFARAQFAFWGAPNASFVTALALPLFAPLWVWVKSPLARLLLLAGLAVSLVGVLIGGYRSVWVMIALTLIIIGYTYRRVAGALGGLAAALLGFLLLPDGGRERILSLIPAAQGSFQDTSSEQRWRLLSYAFRTMLDNLAGLGWMGAGWPHSDVLMLAVNLGLLGGLLFLLWYFATLAPIWRLALGARPDPLALGLLGSFLVAGGLLAVEGVAVLPQMALPVWLVWAMADLKGREGEKRVGAGESGTAAG